MIYATSNRYSYCMNCPYVSVWEVPRRPVVLSVRRGIVHQDTEYDIRAE